jgi:hypothetical protein
MAKTKLKPGIHLMKTQEMRGLCGNIPYINWYWHIVSSNGRIIARSETYSSKMAAVKSIKLTAQMFYMQFQDNGDTAYFDHSKPDSPLKSYL